MEKAISKTRGVFKVAVPTGTALAALHSFAVFHNWYRTIPQIDTLIHFGWTVTLGLFIYWIIQRYPGHVDLGKSFWVTILVGLSLASFGGILWEFGEFTYDHFAFSSGLAVRPVQLGIGDTLKDLFFDLLGGATVAIFVWLRYHRKRKSS